MEQRLHFSGVAELYDEYRPDYPEILFSDILAITKSQNESNVLDIGCGTGKSSDFFIRNNFKVTGIDPSKEMLAVCRKKYSTFPALRLVESDFEKWNFGNERFDLIISGTAFHWVSSEGDGKLPDLLYKNGFVCIFWHTFMNGDAPIFKDLDKLYKKYAPEMWVEDLNAFQEMADIRKIQSISKWHGFTDWRSITYHEEFTYDLHSYINLLRTWSTHADFPSGFYTELETLIRDNGGSIKKPIKTTVCIAKRM
jgi:SAM-dependent methyltransferase